MPKLRLPKGESMIGFTVGALFVEGIIFVGSVVVSLFGLSVPDSPTLCLIGLFPAIAVGWLVAK